MAISIIVCATATLGFAVGFCAGRCSTRDLSPRHDLPRVVLRTMRRNRADLRAALKRGRA